MTLVSGDDTFPIVDWILHNLSFIQEQPNSTPVGHSGTIFGIYDIDKKEKKELLIEERFPYANLIKIETKLKELYQIPADTQVADMGWLFTYATEGYTCKWHTDDSDDESIYHTRLNVMISKPLKGGDPIMKIDGEDVTIKVKENEPWICVAGHYEHSTVPLQGVKPRILLSFGYDIKKDVLKNKKYIG